MIINLSDGKSTSHSHGQCHSHSHGHGHSHSHGQCQCHSKFLTVRCKFFSIFVVLSK